MKSAVRCLQTSVGQLCPFWQLAWCLRCACWRDWRCFGRAFRYRSKSRKRDSTPGQHTAYGKKHIDRNRTLHSAQHQLCRSCRQWLPYNLNFTVAMRGRPRSLGLGLWPVGAAGCSGANGSAGCKLQLLAGCGCGTGGRGQDAGAQVRAWPASLLFAADQDRGSEWQRGLAPKAQNGRMQ